MPSTYNDLYLDTRRALKRSGVDSAALEAREIVCCAADKHKEEFYRDGRLYASPCCSAGGGASRWLIS